MFCFIGKNLQIKLIGDGKNLNNNTRIKWAVLLQAAQRDSE